MNLVTLIRGILSGYALRLIQILASLLVVPFLLQDHILGIETYGRCVAITAALSFLNVVTDGLRVSYSRSIAKALSDSETRVADCVGSGLKVMVLFVALASAALLAGRSHLLSLLGVPVTDEWLAAIAFAIAFVLVENLLYVFESYVLARGRLDFVNQVLAAEVILRNLAYVVLFSHAGGSAVSYMGILSLGSVARCLVFTLYATRRHPNDFDGMWRAPMRGASEVIRYSLSLSAASLHFFIFQRLSIPLVNRFVGAAEAGLLAIALNTIALNASQVLFSVVRPILVPIASRIDLGALSERRRQLIHQVDCLYAASVGLVMAPLVAALPAVVVLWLGEEYDELVFPAQFLVSAAALQVSFNLRRAFLVGQGEAPVLARISLALTAVALVALVFSVGWLASWVAVAITIGTLTALSGAVTSGLVFERRMLRPQDPGQGQTLRRIVALGAALGFGWWLSGKVGASVLWAAVGAGVTATVMLVAAHLLVLPLPSSIRLLRRIRGGARASLFPEEP